MDPGEGWRTARVNRPVLILGSLDGVGVERVFAGQIVDGTGSSGSTAATNTSAYVSGGKSPR